MTNLVRVVDDKIRDYHDDYYTTYYVLYTDGDVTEDQVADDLRKQGYQIDRQDCQHSYDCCGQWYVSGYKLYKLTDHSWLLQVGRSQNI
jgi:hypothetical protein